MRLLKYFARRSAPKILAEGGDYAGISLGQEQVTIFVPGYGLELTREQAWTLTRNLIEGLARSDVPGREPTRKWSGLPLQQWEIDLGNIVEDIDQWRQEHGHD